MLSPRPSAAPNFGDGAVPFAGWSAGRDAAVIAAPAKVNLYLELLGKRADGFHELETLILAVDLFDTLEVRRTTGSEIAVECDTPGVPNGPGNLVWKAAVALQRAGRVNLGAAIRLVKRIPHAAGLGGGSSDAAAAIAVLNRLWGLDWPREALLPVAAEVGSDVGAFLNGPASWCTGRGEKVESAAVGGSVDLVIVAPLVGLSTAAVYGRARVPESPTNGNAARAALRSGDAAKIAAALTNRLEDPARIAEPTVATVLAALEKCRPLGRLVSGSGSSAFAVCRDADDARRVAGEVRELLSVDAPGCRTFAVRGLVPLTP